MVAKSIEHATGAPFRVFQPQPTVDLVSALIRARALRDQEIARLGRAVLHRLGVAIRQCLHAHNRPHKPPMAPVA